MDVVALVERTLDTHVMHELGYRLVPTPGARLVLVLGENAAGKSFFRRLIRSILQDKDSVKDGFYVRSVFDFSMEARSRGGIARGMIYGSEEWGSTGILGVKVLTNSFTHSSQQREGHVIIWDEPDIGMSSRLAASAGRALGRYVASAPAELEAAILASHSPHLVEQAVLATPAHYLWLGSSDGPPTIADWVRAQAQPVLIDLEEACARALERTRAIGKLLG